MLSRSSQIWAASPISGLALWGREKEGLTPSSAVGGPETIPAEAHMQLKLSYASEGSLPGAPTAAAI